jgi:simple sugar transport system ATP-binding protein
VNSARRLGIETVYQDQAVVDDMSVAQNIFLGRELKRHVGPIEILDKKRMREEARKISEYLGLSIATPEQEVRFCSGGERQGVAIARAIHFKAKLVILDEPTTALSVQGAERVLNFVKRLKKDGIASIVITHNIHHVYPIADRFVIMSRGDVVARFEKKNISKSQLMSKLRPSKRK